MQKLNAAMQKLNAGIQKMNAGIRQMSAGIQKMNAGIRKMHAGIQKPNAGTCRAMCSLMCCACVLLVRVRATTTVRAARTYVSKLVFGIPAHTVPQVQTQKSLTKCASQQGVRLSYKVRIVLPLLPLSRPVKITVHFHHRLFVQWPCPSPHHTALTPSFSSCYSQGTGQARNAVRGHV